MTTAITQQKDPEIGEPLNTADTLRDALRRSTLGSESPKLEALIKETRLNERARDHICAQAQDLIEIMRSQAGSGHLLDAFLQEYGLSNDEGVTLMRLAEALIRTPDSATADALIDDRLRRGKWKAHKGASDASLVNLSTRGLMLAAGWLDKTSSHTRDRNTLLRLVGSIGEPVLRTCVRSAMSLLGTQFVLGETIERALKRANKHPVIGCRFSYDMLGEAARTVEDADRYAKSYGQAIEAISSTSHYANVYENPSISVKLSALHPRYEFAQRGRAVPEIIAKLRPLVRAAKRANFGITIDAEEVERLDLSLDVVEGLLSDVEFRGWTGLGVVVQAYRRNALALIDWLGEIAKQHKAPLAVRLVKGAYWDAEIKRAQVLGLDDYPVFTDKAATDVSYLACARRLLDNPNLFYPQFATHNAHTASAILEMAEEGVGFEFQRLFGMGESLHNTLLKRYGARCRIYAPVGCHKDLLAYLVRRLLENGANSSFVHQALDRTLPAEHVARDPVSAVLSAPPPPNPVIPVPRDLFDGARSSAQGWDLNDPLTIKSVGIAVEKAAKQEFIAGPIIDGRLRQGKGTPITNPAKRHEVVGQVNKASSQDASDALDSAAKAAQNWGAKPPSERAEILSRAADLLEQRYAVFFHLAIAEAGKTLEAAVAELREAIDFCRYYAGGAQLSNMEGRKALGVVCCISPWNFPLAIFLGQVTASLAAGNAVIAKPAEQTPLIAAEAVRILHEAGVPGDVLHLIPGDGASVGAMLIADPKVKGVCFTGSTATAKNIQLGICERGQATTPLIAETGGINAMIVDSTALIEQTVDDIVASAFNSAGQRCSALRILCVQDDIADALLKMLAGAMAELRIGDPNDLSTDVGPVIDSEAYDRISRHIKLLNSSSPQIAIAPEAILSVEGHFVRPVAYEVKSVSEVTLEIFGPVLHVVRFAAGSIDALVEEINSLGFGLTLGVQSRIDGVVDQIAARAKVGNLYVNRNQIGAVVGVQPFGGEGLSGTGPKAGGPNYLRRLSRPPVRENISVAGPTFLSDEPPADPNLGAYERLIKRARIAQQEWARFADRGAVLLRAARELETVDPASAKYLKIAADEVTSVFDRQMELPSPTGERNSISYHGRGVLLCLGGADGAAMRQAVCAISGKNAVLILAAACDLNSIKLLKSALESAGAPKCLIDVIAPLDGWLWTGLCQSERFAGMVFDGADTARRQLAGVLAKRCGAIVPLLSMEDDFERFAVERTVTINTTAAGGNVALLSGSTM